MADEFRIDIEARGHDDVRRALRNLGPAMQAKLIPAGNLAAARVIAKRARADAPVRSGAYKASIATGRHRKSPDAWAGATAPHAHLVEDGTIRQAPNPVLRRALASTLALQFEAAVKAMRRRWASTVRSLRTKGAIR